MTFDQEAWNKKVSQVVTKSTLSLEQQFQSICALIKEAHEEGMKEGYFIGWNAAKKQFK